LLNHHRVNYMYAHIQYWAIHSGRQYHKIRVQEDDQKKFFNKDIV